LPAIVAAARAAWGGDVQVFAAIGHGRSYGAPSRVLARTLPGILASGLWRAIASLPAAPTRAVVGDVGNDILYGFSAERILAWVAEAVGRLQRVTRDIVLTDLPMAGIRRLSPAKFLLLRSILFPCSRLPLSQVKQTAERVSAGLAELSGAGGMRRVHLKPAWYGFDPIHIRPSSWPSAWPEILGIPGAARAEIPLPEALRIYRLPPERRSLLGWRRFTPQPGVRTGAGGRLWLY
jgi:hypothetical protein